MDKSKLQQLFGKDSNKRPVMMLAICLALIIIATFFGALIQTGGFQATVEDLRGATNSGTITLTPTGGEATEYTVRGEVESGILFSPKKASEDDLRPAVVFTHGLYNNREMQLQNAIEMVRRGYYVLVIDRAAHGHNTNSSDSPYGLPMLQAAKYLYNLPGVDKTKIAVSGHSMGGNATNAALQIDGIDNAAFSAGGTRYEAGTDASYRAGYHMGIISAALTQANNVPSASYIGSNVIAVGNVKASADEFFYASTLKEPAYVAVNKDRVTELNYTDYYVKKGDDYVKVTAEDKFRPNKQYYNYTTRGNSTFYLQSSQAVNFTGRDSTTLDDWTTVNGGIYNVADGQLFMDGQDVNSLTIRSVRSACAYVPQDNFLFSDTISHNIAFGVDAAGQDAIEHAARLADVHDNVAAFKEGYNTVLGERGVTVSGGQKQRISIARALLMDAPVLILDDSVSAVDTRTEKVILDNLNAERAGKTTILIAHRISTVERMDKIVFIDDGQVVDVGAHDELYARCADYRKMVDLQRLEDELGGGIHD